MIIDTTIELLRWVNKVADLPFKRRRLVLKNGLSFEGYIIAETTLGVFFKTEREFKENLMFAEWFPFSCLIK